MKKKIFKAMIVAIKFRKYLTLGGGDWEENMGGRFAGILRRDGGCLLLTFAGCYVLHTFLY